MKWASAVSTVVPLDAAVADATAQVRAQLDGAQADLIVVFVSPHYAGEFDRLPQRVRASCGPAVLIGCSAGGVIGGGTEVEQRPALSVTAAVLPGVRMMPFHLESAALAGLDQTTAWQRLLGLPETTTDPHFLLLPDPFTFDAEAFLRGLDRAYPCSRTIGGLASGGTQPGSNALFLGDDVYRSGLVGVAFAGDIEIDTIVAQGCRPIGQPMFVTRCEANVIWELDGRPAVAVLQELYEQLDPADQELARHALFLGIVMKEDRHEYRQGDFLIRNLVGMDPARGAIAIGALMQDNAVVQFHLRDAKTSAEDLEQLLARYTAEAAVKRPEGALLFSCLGRGQHLYGRPDHDTGAFQRHVGTVPIGGFFCNGEIGPVHGTTFLHGYTSSFGLFRRKS
jgi:small ligand-binding sensory domain FIST